MNLILIDSRLPKQQRRSLPDELETPMTNVQTEPMPELPEVETVARDLRSLLIGRTVLAVRTGKKSLRRPWSKAWRARVVGRRVEAIARRGKWLLVELHDGGVLLVHLGMTGQFTVAPPGTVASDHTHLTFPLDNRHELRFRDPRRFGSVTYYPDQSGPAVFLSSKLGPEPWDAPAAEWRGSVKATRRSLKALLLDQTILAGVGNIYADESCCAAGIDPRRLGASLTPAEADRILAAVRSVLTRAIEARGSTIRDYVGGSGLKGGYQNEFRVYGRPGEPCARCGGPIQCVRLAGRSTHFCPVCQK